MVKDCFRFVVAMVLVVAWSCPVFAATYWVDGVKGDDTRSGTSAINAVKTFPKASSLLAENDELKILAGIYVLHDATDRLNITKPGVTVTGVGSVVFVGGPSTASFALMAIVAGSDRVRVRNLRFESTFIGITAAGGNGEYENLTFFKTTMGASTFSANRFVGCVFVDCATGMGVGASDCAVVNCTFKKCANTAVSWSSGAPSNLRFQNNIFFKNTFVAKGPSSPGFIFSHNILFQNTTASNEQGMQALGVENLVVDPQFVVDDLFSTNVELKPTSPAILAGVDLEGQRTRNIGARGPGLVAGTETTASPLNFALWKDQNGALTATSSAVLLDTDGSLLLKPGVTTAVLRSPVIDVATLLNRSNMRLKAIRLDTLEAAAIGKLVDSDPATPEREFRFRVNGTSFSEIEDAAALPFVTATHGQILLTPQANFVQIEVTLRQP